MAKILKDLLEKTEYELVQGSLETPVADIAYDSRKIAPGMLFMAIEGTVVDGHKFIPDVLERGASVLVVEKDVAVEDKDVTVVKVKNGRAALSKMSAAYFDYPSKKMTSIGITGTKGKSTTTYMVRDIIEKSGKTCGIVGTIGVSIKGKVTPTEHTTPESYDLQKYFADMVEAGCDYMVMEVSSQGIKMDRVAGMEFDYGVFTNLSPDHIGPNEHKDFDEYLSCKAELFRMCQVGIVNSDDPHWKDIVENATCEVKTYGTKEADMTADAIEHINEGGELSMKFHASGLLNGDVIVGLPGRFNIYNGMCAACVGALLGMPQDIILHALEHVEVRGRVESVPTGRNFSVLIDFAHNGVSTESVLKTLRGYNPGRIIAIFGCGGNRSKLRRYEMGEAVGNLAELAVVTSDNPRTEDVMDIIEDIKVGLAKTKGEYVVIPDRQEAVNYAVQNAKDGDMIILLGKGHEEYQEINGVKHHYSEREAVANALASLG
ncbi:MAG: UDP-N-acetylmuramoyl-L-alanyl-D-glutamate--2,6-diaminopimelate ligase [Lachnospiraceae bacterium]|nr:UDP-N-acetylmuramoyl-L-alanyl-D-glutamate--2,6-diaminopimelate ligase [Lachnospiraceae bacterium]